MFGTSLKRVGSADRLAQASTALPPAAGASHAASHRHQRRLALRFRGCRLGLPVPSEMWGAAALAARMARPSCIQPQQLHRAASAVLAQVSGPGAFLRIALVQGAAQDVRSLQEPLETLKKD